MKKDEELILCKVGEKINIVKKEIDCKEYFILEDEALKEGEELLIRKLSFFLPSKNENNIVLTIGEPIKYGELNKKKFPLMTEEEWKQFEKEIEEREKRSINVDGYLNEPINKKG